MMEVTEDGEQCIDCLRYAYDPHQDECLICGRGQLRPDENEEYAELQYESNAAADLDPDWPRERER